MMWLSIFVSFLAGMLLSLQGAVNSGIGKMWGNLQMVASVSIIQIVVASIFLLPNLIKVVAPLSYSPVWLSGALGVCILFGIAFSVSKLGALITFALVIFGQLFFSTILDTFGLVGTDIKPLSMQRILGVAVILIGVLMLLRSQ